MEVWIKKHGTYTLAWSMTERVWYFSTGALSQLCCVAWFCTAETFVSSSQIVIQDGLRQHESCRKKSLYLTHSSLLSHIPRLAALRNSDTALHSLSIRITQRPVYWSQFVFHYLPSSSSRALLPSIPSGHTILSWIKPRKDNNTHTQA